MYRRHENKSELNVEAKEDTTKNILSKKQTGAHLLLNANFDPGLLRLFKEVKYLQILNMEMPEEAKAAFEKYNNIIFKLNEAERPK